MKLSFAFTGEEPFAQFLEHIKLADLKAGTKVIEATLRDVLAS